MGVGTGFGGGCDTGFGWVLLVLFWRCWVFVSWLHLGVVWCCWVLVLWIHWAWLLAVVWKGVGVFGDLFVDSKVVGLGLLVVVLVRGGGSGGCLLGWLFGFSFSRLGLRDILGVVGFIVVCGCVDSGWLLVLAWEIGYWGIGFLWSSLSIRFGGDLLRFFSNILLMSLCTLPPSCFLA